MRPEHDMAADRKIKENTTCQGEPKAAMANRNPCGPDEWSEWTEFQNRIETNVEKTRLLPLPLLHRLPGASAPAIVRYSPILHTGFCPKKMCAVDFWPIKIDVFMGNVGKIMIQWRFFKGREDLGTSSSGPSLLALSAAQPAPRLHCPGPVWVGPRTKGGPRPIFKTWNFGDQTSKDAKSSKSFFSDVILIILTPCTKWFPDVDYTLRFESMGCLISTANPVCMVQRNCLPYNLEQMCKDSKWSK